MAACLYWCIAVFVFDGLPFARAAANFEYNEQAAIAYLYLSAVANCVDDRIQDWSCGIDCNQTSAFVLRGSPQVLGPTAHYQVRGYVARTQSSIISERQCVVAIAGTSFYNINNIRADAEGWLSQWPTWRTESGPCALPDWCQNCYVHHGFASAYEELRPQMLAALQNLSCSRVVVTGHSLGAALATLASMELRACHDSGTRVSGVWTYASPRVGNAAFVAKYISAWQQQYENTKAFPPMWRLVNEFDLIPQLGPTLLGYRHIPVEVLYSSNSTSFKVCDSTNSLSATEDPDCLYSGGTMKMHHNYLGIKETDENKVGHDCIPGGEMQMKQRTAIFWLVPLLLLVVCMGCTSCVLCFACVCCTCHCLSGRATTADDKGICVCVCGSPCCFLDLRYNLPGLIARRLPRSTDSLAPLHEPYTRIEVDNLS